MKRRSLLAALGVTGAAVVLAGAGAGVAGKLQADDAYAIAAVKVDPSKVDRTPATSHAAALRAMRAVRALAQLQGLRAIKRQLRKLGLDPNRAVIQRGRWNYAGPDCPGRAWTCTKGSGVVIQLADGGGSGGGNEFKCSPSYPSPPPSPGTSKLQNRCYVVQVSTAGNNTAECRIRNRQSTVTQSCTITQTSTTGNNKATVYQEAIQSGSTATQEAEVSQTATGSGSNSLFATQVIGQIASNSNVASQSQTGRQFLSGSQTASTGNNTADVSQNVGQRAFVQNSPSTTQTQFAYQTIVGDGTAGPGFTPTQNPGIDQSTLAGDNFADVDQRQGQSLEGRQVNTLTQNQNFTAGDALCSEKIANTCAIVEQVESGAGDNSLTAHQITLQDERVKNVPAGGLNQNMGTATGGLDGSVFQNGLSTTEIDQDHLQNWVGPSGGGGARIIDPRCCQQQIGDPGSTVDIDQLAYQQGPVNGLEQATNAVECGSVGTCNTHSVIDQVTAFSEVNCSSSGIGQACIYEQECTEETCNFPGSTTVPETTTISFLSSEQE